MRQLRRWRQYWRSSFFRELGLQLLVSSILCSLITIILLGCINEVSRSSDAEALSSERINAAESLLQLLTDAETGQRGYILSNGDTRYVERYRIATSLIEDQQQRLKELVATDPQEASEVLDINLAMSAKLNELAWTVRLVDEGNIERAIEVFQTDRGKAYMDTIRRSIEQIKVIEGAKRLERERATRVFLRGSYLTAALLGVAALTSQLYSYQLVKGAIKERDKAERDARALARRNELLAEQLRYIAVEEIIPQIASAETRDSLLAELESIQRE